MAKEQFEENLYLQRAFGDLVAPGGLGQVSRTMTKYITYKCALYTHKTKKSKS